MAACLASLDVVFYFTYRLLYSWATSGHTGNISKFHSPHPQAFAKQLLPSPAVTMYVTMLHPPHPPQVVVTKMRQMAYDAKMPMEHFMSMENNIQATWKSAGDALRIKFQAMPQVQSGQGGWGMATRQGM